MEDSFLIPDPINQTARDKFGIDFVFPFQRLVISNILRAGKISGFETDPDYAHELAPQQIVLLPTGAGKSLCFMLPAFLLEGITLVVFPLLSLLADQLRRAEECGLKAVILRGGQSSFERERIINKCRQGEIKMILTNPETLSNKELLRELSNLPIDHVVVDETHIVSEWGDSFRPAYLELNAILKQLSPPLITAFTATASEHILGRVREILFPDCTPNIIYGNPDRPNIHYSVITSLSPSQDLLELVNKSEKPLIIFSSSRTKAELTSRMLRRKLKSNRIFFYHAGLDKAEKDKIEKWFFSSRDGILSATCAYGMGIDKGNIRTVIHTEPPTTVESYLQESGRAGRDRQKSKAYLIFTPEAERKLSKIPQGLSRQRYQSMLQYCRETDLCRREKLLSMLNSEPEICSGCDICDGIDSNNRVWEAAGAIIARNRRRFTKRQFIYFLKGYVTEEIKANYYHERKGFGFLSQWDTDMIEEMIELMIKDGVLKLPGKGFRKHRLSI